MLEALQTFVRDREKAVWGTCAGMILMAEGGGIGGGKVIPGRERQRGWAGIAGLKVWRNLYGSKCAPSCLRNLEFRDGLPRRDEGASS
jgi:5'-phosphate synthase pdxT subunit